MMRSWNGHFEQALLMQFLDCMGLGSPSGSPQTMPITDEMIGIAQTDLEDF
jgi:hypothetical protein